MKHKTSVIICAAGKGERAGFGKNKLLAPLYGAPVLWHTLKKFDIGAIDEVIVAASKDDYGEISAICAPFGFKAVAGGGTRTESVKNALGFVTGDIVLIHDGARPFVSEEVILRCIEGVKKYGSAVCAVGATDTAAIVEDGYIVGVPSRPSVYCVQTPQGFYTRDISGAYEKAGGKAYTDDGAVYAEFIGKPHIVEGERKNVKLTYKEDFGRAFPVLKTERGARVGFGADVHAFGKRQDYIMLCGVEIPCDTGLIAHSDGDVALHAVMDALLSAAGLKDIGHYFPDGDRTYKNADSARLLEKVLGLLAEKNLTVCSLSVAVQAEKPKLSAYIDGMVLRLAALTGADRNNISVTAGTCEGLGFVGEGRGICVYCAAALRGKENTNGEN